VVDHPLQLLRRQLVLVPIKVEEALRDRRRARLVVGVVVWFEVGVLQRLLDRDALGRIERQQPLQQIQGQGIRARKQRREWDFLLEGQIADVFARAPALDGVIILHARRPQHLQDERELVVIILAWEERLPAQHLSQDASHAPDVDGFGVFFEGEHDFRGAVPSRSHVLGHEPAIIL